MHQPEGPRQRLRLFDATTLVVGSMIGSAIFLALPLMARQVPSPAVLIGLWVLGGLFAVLGELLRRAGGDAAEQRRTIRLLPRGVRQSLGVPLRMDAIPHRSDRHQRRRGHRLRQVSRLARARLRREDVLATIPLGNLLPATMHAYVPHGLESLQINSAQVVAAAVIVLLTAVNIRGLREGVWVQNVFTVLKVTALAALIIAGLSHGIGSPHFIPPAETPAKELVFGAGLLAGLAVALSKALFAYDAWYTVTFVAEEVHDSKRTLPYSLLLGTVIVTAVYVLANLAYLAVLPVDRIAGVEDDRVAVAVGMPCSATSAQSW